ncbi:MAG: lycopene cyclase domain-containing protein [Bacteroidota bacterium]
MAPYTYLLLDVLTLAIPLARSFEPRIAFYKKWPAWLPAIAITSAFFILWDALFTHWQVWGFNESYLLGIYILNIPLEEVLFFIAIPYACLFLYETLNLFFVKDMLAPYQRSITLLLIGLLAILGGANLNKAYTATTFLLTALFLCLHLSYFKSTYLGRFYRAYLVVLFPFFIVNGVLTGSGLTQPVVWYNDYDNLGLRLLTIPVEDVFYGLLLILMNLTLYKAFQKVAWR